MENVMEIAIVPVIVALVYLLVELYKIIIKESENLMRFIPVIAAGLGIILGIVAFYVAPEIIAAENVFVAALIGAASGLGATGTNQVFKQLAKFKSPSTQNPDTQNKTEI